MGEGGHEDAHLELGRARDALSDARVLLDGDGTETGVLNRLYYAAFHGAQAALYAHGNNPSSHGHVRQQFGQQLVLEGHAKRELGRLLGRLYDYRREADYGAGPPAVDLRALYDDVREFLVRMDELVTERETDS